MASDRFEEVVDQFEMHWHESSREMIFDLLLHVHMDGNVEAMTELIRIDIQRRYSANLPVDLQPYLDLMARFSDCDEVLCAIAYEDFRTRQSRDLRCSLERWKEIPGIGDQRWYQELVTNRGPKAGRQIHPSDDGIEQVMRPEPLLTAAEGALRSVGFLPIRQIGHGAFSRVFLARQKSLANRPVVIKAVQRDFEEADRMAELQHTNIVPIYSFHRSGPWSLLCMPYAGLVTLADYFKAVPESNHRSGQSIVSTIQQAQEGTLRKAGADDRELGWPLGLLHDETPPLTESVFDRIMPLQRDALVLWLFSRIADGLHHAHKRGILHGDIKPANLLVRNDGEPALLDFNLSRKFNDAEPATIGGTLPYMSPESLRALMGANVAISVESDVYSLGAVLYQFLTNRLAYTPPHSSASIDLELAITQRQKQVQWNESDKVSPGTRAIVEKCLAASASDRYESAEQLRDDLECERQHLPLKHTREPSVKHRLHKWIARHPRATSAASVTIAAVAVILVMSWVTWRVNESRKNLLAAQAFEEFESKSKIALAEMLYVSPAGNSKTIKAAQDCLSTYGVLQDERWQERSEWNRLSEFEHQRALSLMTSLLLKVSWNEIHQSSLALTDQRSEEDVGPQHIFNAAELLSRAPFVSQAPVSIGFISEAIRSTLPTSIKATRVDSELLQNDVLTPLDRLGLAAKYIEQGDGEAAVKLLPAGLLTQVDAYTYWITLGRAQMTMSDLRAAELSFSMAIEIYPGSPAAFHYRGVCRMKKRETGELKKAVEDFSLALQRNPDALESLTNRAMAREATGDYPGAMEDLQRVVLRNPNDAQALIVQSRVHRKQNNAPAAKRALGSAMRSRPNTVAGLISLALTRLAFDKQAALRDLLQAQKISPDSIEVLQNLAHVYSEHLDEPEKAIDALDRLLTINPKFEMALLGRGVLRARSGEVDAALEDLKTAIATNGELQSSSLYQAACIFAQNLTHVDTPRQMKYQELALGYLSSALQKGYGAEFFESDPDLAPLRDDPRFSSIQSTVQTSRILKQAQWYDE